MVTDASLATADAASGSATADPDDAFVASGDSTGNVDGGAFACVRSTEAAAASETVADVVDCTAASGAVITSTVACETVADAVGCAAASAVVTVATTSCGFDTAGVATDTCLGAAVAVPADTVGDVDFAPGSGSPAIVLQHRATVAAAAVVAATATRAASCACWRAFAAVAAAHATASGSFSASAGRYDTMAPATTQPVAYHRARDIAGVIQGPGGAKDIATASSSGPPS